MCRVFFSKDSLMDDCFLISMAQITQQLHKTAALETLRKKSDSKQYFCLLEVKFNSDVAYCLFLCLPFQSTSSILKENMDLYMLNPCSTKIWWAHWRATHLGCSSSDWTHEYLVPWSWPIFLTHFFQVCDRALWAHSSQAAGYCELWALLFDT